MLQDKRSRAATYWTKVADESCSKKRKEKLQMSVEEM
jgi:hypothetical protein